MEDKIVGCFVDSAVQVLGSELGCAVTVGDAVIEDAEYRARGVTSMVGVTGALRGMVIIGLTESTALAVVSQMMGQKYEQFDSMAQSGIGELGNVMVGAAVTSLTSLGYQCGITPPAVVTGRDTTITMLNLKRVALPLNTEFGMVDMQLVLRENGRH